LYDKILGDARFPELLREVDEELARTAQESGCPECGAAVDAAHYLRQPRGWPWELSKEQCKRLSFCCRRDGCRRRKMAPSVRFLGRRVYLGAIVVLAGVLGQGATSWRVARLQAVLGADRRTLMRWRRWWMRLASSREFVVGRGDFMPAPASVSLPGSLLECFRGTEPERLVVMLRWMGRQFGARFPGDTQGSAEDAR